MLLGSIGASPVASPVRADDLADARARQAALKKQISRQRSQVSQLNSMQAALSSEIRNTTRELRSINADLTAVRRKIGSMETKIEEVKAAYAALVLEGQVLAASLARVEKEEQEKAADLRERKNLLAERIRSAYDTNRVSLLETLLSGGTFTDLLTEASYLIDVGEQDKALAQQIERDQEILASVHQTVVETRTATRRLARETAAHKRALDRSLAALKDAKAQLARLEKQTKRMLAKQKAAYQELARNKKNLRQAIARAQANQKALARRIDRIVERQARAGKIPSQYNGTFRWPMVGRISGEFGCSSYPGYGPGYGCAHFHNGIDIVADYGTPIRAAGPGTVVHVGYNWADGADPAWIVIIAHSTSLKTWYAHMQPRSPSGIRVGARVKAGQIVGWEGNTGNSTGAHLHWMVELNGTWKNPRLFL